MNVSRETTTPAQGRSLVEAQFDVSRETMARLDRFADMLLRWNGRINLIARADEGRLWERHIADSLQLIPFLTGGKRLTDLGSGGGFPGLILAIAIGTGGDTRFGSGTVVTLVEADSRKAAFLREAAREAGARVTILVSRIEDADCSAVADIVTARALAPLPKLLPLAYRLLARDGICLFLKGAAAAEELTACEGAWNMQVERHPSRIDPQGCILRLSEVSRV